VNKVVNLLTYLKADVPRNAVKITSLIADRYTLRDNLGLDLAGIYNSKRLHIHA
jgi:hypothetical protein